MKRNLTILAALMGALLALESTAQAGFVKSVGYGSGHLWDLTPVASPNSWGTTNWATSGSATVIDGTTTWPDLQVKPSISVTSLSADTSSFTGVLDSDPHVDLIELVQNNSGVNWNGFDIQISPGANSQIVPHSVTVPASPFFGTNPFPHYTIFENTLTGVDIVHFDGATVLSGSAPIVLQVGFDISLISPIFPNPFAYNIVNTPPRPSRNPLHSACWLWAP